MTEDDEKPPARRESAWAYAFKSLGEALTVGFICASIVAIVYINVRW